MPQTRTALECIKNFNHRTALIFLFSLIFLDLAFVALHGVNRLTDFIDNPLYNIDKDRGYAEFFQYIKLALNAGLFVFISWQNKSFRYIPWALVLTYFLIDDSMQVHEVLGGWIMEDLDFEPAFGLRIQDYGELAVSAFFGALLFPPLAWAYFSGSREFKKTSHDIIFLILILVFFGVVIDMVHMAVNMGWKVDFLLGAVEDGGEMVSVSLMLWYAYTLKLRSHTDNDYLLDIVFAVLRGRFT